MVKKKNILYIGFIFFTTSLFSLPKCSYNFIIKQKNIRKTYYNLRNHDNKCYLTIHHFLNFAERSFLAGRLSESLWACDYGLKNSKSEMNIIPLRYIKSLALYDKGRFEEAIIELKKIMNYSIRSHSLQEYKEKSLLLLIQVYSKKENPRSKNVQYLRRLYKSKYKNSKYVSLVSYQK